MSKPTKTSGAVEPVEEIEVKTIEAPYLSAGVIYTDEYSMAHAGMVVGVGKEMTKVDDPMTVCIAVMLDQTTSGVQVVHAVPYSAVGVPKTWRWPK